MHHPTLQVPRINIPHRPTYHSVPDARRSRSGDSLVLFKTFQQATVLKITMMTKNCQTEINVNKMKTESGSLRCDAESLRAHRPATIVLQDAACTINGSYQRRDGKGGCGRRVAVATGGST